MSELPIKATLKAGGGYDAPWLTVDASDPNDLAFKLKGLIEHESALNLVVEAANALKAVNNVGTAAAPQAAPVQQAAPAQPQQQAWGATPAAQQQNVAPPQQGPKLHPTDTCTLCGQRPQEKDVFRKSDGKKFEFWSCPNQKKRDDGHYNEFRN